MVIRAQITPALMASVILHSIRLLAMTITSAQQGMPAQMALAWEFKRSATMGWIAPRIPVTQPVAASTSPMMPNVMMEMSVQPILVLRV